MKTTRIFVVLVAVVAACMLVQPVTAAEGNGQGDTLGRVSSSATDATFNAETAKTQFLRCGTPEPWMYPEIYPDRDTADCTMGLTNPDPMYDPDGSFVYEIPVVVHIITNSAGTLGDLTDEMVQSQIDVLNEDYQALPGTLGENGNFSGIRFVLATEDPDGLPTTGITRTANDTWFVYSDEQGMKTALNWDPNRYLNLYTLNPAGGLLGSSWFPQWGVGGWQDCIIFLYTAFGRNSPAYPYNLGRTATHEVGHWVGLLHPFQGGCGTATTPGCYSTADLICDTNPDASSSFGCPTGTSCGSYPIPVENYMEYTDDACMELFTPEQVNRMICSLTSYRPDVYTVVLLDGIFADGFEDNTTNAWSNVVP